MGPPAGPRPSRQRQHRRAASSQSLAKDQRSRVCAGASFWAKAVARSAPHASHAGLLLSDCGRLQAHHVAASSDVTGSTGAVIVVAVASSPTSSPERLSAGWAAMLPLSALRAIVSRGACPPLAPGELTSVCCKSKAFESGDDRDRQLAPSGRAGVQRWSERRPCDRNGVPAGTNSAAHPVEGQCSASGLELDLIVASGTTAVPAAGRCGGDEPLDCLGVAQRVVEGGIREIDHVVVGL
jgi:hypothetical protein